MQTEAESFWTQPRDRPALVHLRAIHIAAFAAVAAAFVAVALRLADRAEEREDRVIIHTDTGTDENEMTDSEP
jgi:hypothetical protein